MENLNKKQFLTYDEQITFLEKQKGLIISDKEYARRTLLKIGYFPLINGYKEVFKQSINDQFQKGTTFEDIYELYSFDNELRNIFLKYILMAERNIKSSLSYHFCKEDESYQKGVSIKPWRCLFFREIWQTGLQKVFLFPVFCWG